MEVLIEILLEFIVTVVFEIIVEGALGFAYWFLFKSRLPKVVKAVSWILITGGIIWSGYSFAMICMTDGAGVVGTVVTILITLVTLGVLYWAVITTYLKISKLKKYGQENILGNEYKIIIEHYRGDEIYEHPGQTYQECVGYIQDKYDQWGNRQKAYLLSNAKNNVDTFEGKVVAIVHRNNGENIWVLNTDKMDEMSRREIKKKVKFLEQYYDSEIFI